MVADTHSGADFPPVPMERWGKAHWSLLAYVYAMIAAGRALERSRMTVNRERHPLLAHRPFWDPAWSTKLKDGEQLQGHDEVDGLLDLEAAGLVNVGTLMTLAVEPTDKGRALALQLEAHKRDGGSYSTFNPRNAPAPESL